MRKSLKNKRNETGFIFFKNFLNTMLYSPELNIIEILWRFINTIGFA